MNKYLVALSMIGSLLVVGWMISKAPKEFIHQTVGEIKEEVTTGTITDAQERFGHGWWGTSLGRLNTSH